MGNEDAACTVMNMFKYKGRLRLLQTFHELQRPTFVIHVTFPCTIGDRADSYLLVKFSSGANEFS